MRRRRLIYLSIIAIIDPDVNGYLIFTLVGTYLQDRFESILASHEWLHNY